jgi:hypothetical protein
VRNLSRLVRIARHPLSLISVWRQRLPGTVHLLVTERQRQIDTGNRMSEETQISRPTLNTYDDIDAALTWLRRYARSRAELCALVVQYYAVDLDMLAYRLTA